MLWIGRTGMIGLSMASVIASLASQPPVAFAGSCSVRGSASANGADVELHGAATCSGGVQAIRFVKLGVNLYDNMSQSEALRDIIRRTDDQLIALETRRVRQQDMLDQAQRALGLCQDRAAKKLPPDPGELF